MFSMTLLSSKLYTYTNLSKQNHLPEIISKRYHYVPINVELHIDNFSRFYYTSTTHAYYLLNFSCELPPLFQKHQSPFTRHRHLCLPKADAGTRTGEQVQISPTFQKFSFFQKDASLLRSALVLGFANRRKSEENFSLLRGKTESEYSVGVCFASRRSGGSRTWSSERGPAKLPRKLHSASAASGPHSFELSVSICASSRFILCIR